MIPTPKGERLEVLLVYPIWVTAAGRGRLQRMLPPLGVLSIASHLESKNISVQVLDLHAEQLSPEEFRLRIRELRPRFVGISVLSSHLVATHHLSQIIKQEVADCQIIAGGVHAEAYPELMLQDFNIDAIARGDGEELMSEFVLGRERRNIAGLSFRLTDGTIQHNSPRTLKRDLDSYPFPAYHLIDFKNYFPAIGTYRRFPAINALMTRGCPGQCTFCNSARTPLRGRSPQKMVELIEHLRRIHGIRQLTFYDDTFTANPKVVKEFCRLMIERNVDVSFVCYARGDMFSEELAQLLAQAGCHQVLLGIESGSESLMRKIGKPISKEKYHRVVELAHQNGIEVRGAFIIGHLDETQETLEETLQFAMDLNLDFFQPSILTPYPGTQLYRQAKQEGLLLHENFGLYGQGEVILKMRHLSSEQLLNFYNHCFWRFYFRPKMILRQLYRLRSLRQILDLAHAFYIILVEGLRFERSRRLHSWLNFPIPSHWQKPTTPRLEPLTWQVRQSEASL